MKFTETLLHKVLIHPVKAWESMNLYYFILATPFLTLHFIVGFLIAIVVDAWLATAEAGA